MRKDPEQLTMEERAEAVGWWILGRNTADIAVALNTRECVIYNHLPKWRAEHKNAVAA